MIRCWPDDINAFLSGIKLCLKTKKKKNSPISYKYIHELCSSYLYVYINSEWTLTAKPWPVKPKGRSGSAGSSRGQAADPAYLRNTSPRDPPSRRWIGCSVYPCPRARWWLPAAPSSLKQRTWCPGWRHNPPISEEPRSSQEHLETGCDGREACAMKTFLSCPAAAHSRHASSSLWTTGMRNNLWTAPRQVTMPCCSDMPPAAPKAHRGVAELSKG